jgi:Domain of unknown function (DUF4340)
VTARRFWWLLIFAVLLIALAIWLSSKRHLDRDLSTGDLVLPGLEQNVNAVTSVGLRKGDATHVTLQKDGALWQVAERGWPADEGKLRKLLLDLGALNIVEEKTRLPANYPALGVEDVSSPKATGTRIDISAPPRSWALIVGKSSSGKSGYVRVASMPQSLLAAPLLSVDADPKSWLQNALLDINAARVHEIAARPAQGAAFTAVRAKKDEISFTVSPLPKGRQLTGPAAPEGIAGGLSGLTLDDVHKATPVPDAQLSHIVYRTFDGVEIELAGRRDGAHPLVVITVRSTTPESAAEAQRLAARVNGWEFEIPDYKYTVIYTPLEELLQKPPEPAKKAAAGKGTAAPPPPSNITR